MTGYYPRPQDGELIMSSSAASIAMHIGGSNIRRERKRLLGFEDFGFGGIIPSHCRALQANVPSVAGLTDEAVLDGSAYHIVAPTYLPDERERLLDRIFDGRHQGGLRQIFPGHRVQYLQYCVECAREDDKRGNRQCWRVLPNIPGNNTCGKHGLLLTTTKARSSGATIPPDAGEWINLQSPSVASRNIYDVQLAKDLQWLYQLKSRVCPGWKNLAAALTIVLAKRPEYRRTRHYLNVDAIVRDLRAIRDIAERVEPRLLRRVRLAKILYQRERASIPFYSLLGIFVGVDLKSLFELACDPSTEKTQYATMAADRIRFRKAKGPGRLVEVKVRLMKYLTKNPCATRTHLNNLCSEDVRYAIQRDPVWFAKEMPWPVKGFKNRQEWKFRDEYFHRRLQEELIEGEWLSRIKRVGAKTVLRMAGMPPFLLINAQGRLPKTLRLVNDFVRRPNGSLPYRSGCRKRLSSRCM